MAATRWVGAALALCVAGPAPGAPLQGVVHDGAGGPVAGAMVTAQGAHLPALAITVYSGAQGRYRFADLPDDSTLTVTAGRPGMAPSAPTPARPGQPGPTLKLGTAGAPPLPAAAYLADSADSPGGRLVVKECVSCHQFPSAAVRDFAVAVRAAGTLQDAQTTALWHAQIASMRARNADIRPVGSSFEFPSSPETSFISRTDEDAMVPYLVDQLASVSVRADPAAGLDGAIAAAQLREYAMPGAAQGMIHDVVSAPGPGGRRYGWGADFQNNGVVRVDPESGATRWIAAPPGHAGVHSLIPDGKGSLWVSLNLSNAIARFDPLAETWQVFEGFPPFGLPHSIGVNQRFEVAWDRAECLWASLIASNQLARLCPQTGQVTAFDLPAYPDQSPGYTRAYGVVLTADRGRVWFTQVGGDALGALDATTGELVHHVVFERGVTPRRLAIGDDDVLWIPLYGSGELLAYDARAARQIGRWPLPLRASAPYVASWDARRRQVWVGTSNADEIYRFDPRSHAFTRYPLPRAGAFMRSIPVDPDTGVVWTSYSAIPPAAGPDVMLRLDPGD